MSHHIRDAISDIHPEYVKEHAKLGFIADSLRVRADEFCLKCPDIHGVAWSLIDIVNALQTLNDKLDAVGFMRPGPPE